MTAFRAGAETLAAASEQSHPRRKASLSKSEEPVRNKLLSFKGSYYPGQSGTIACNQLHQNKSSSTH